MCRLCHRLRPTRQKPSFGVMCTYSMEGQAENAVASTTQSETRRRKGSKHDKTGCLTCRYRRKKCVENTFPTCGSCARLNLKCVRSSARDVVPPSWVDQKQSFKQIEPTPRTSNVPESSSSFPLCSTMPTGDHLEPHQKRQVMRYYITVLCHYLTASEQFNSFLSAFLPMAMESNVLYDALVAFASGHLSLSNESYKLTALKAHSTAISNFTTALSAPQQHVTWYETQAATCLAFVVGEVSRGDNHGWSAHLHGAKLLIESAVVNTSKGRVLRGPDVFKNSSEGQWILRNFAYHDIIGSVTLRRRPLLDCGYLDGITDVVDTYLGVATDLLRHVATLSILDEETKLGPEFAAEDISKRKALFYVTCSKVEQDLQHWQCRHDAAPELAAMAYAFRGAVLIILYRLIRDRLTSEGDGKGGRFTAPGWNTLPAKIRTQVSNILRHVSDISIGSHTESAILFPLFLAGSEATEDGHMDAVRVRLQMTLQKRQFQNIARALTILEDLWQRRQVAGTGQVDWTDILDETGEHLLLT
ncbi:fungal-specific transcription factor domain-containing protein [Colletotrichum navitas]|uniref:Fungal-specific transcription factor domain-containing protein n=1 Tax=Colletotrichum navitas TaxID=681940 RepID=A0AAD8UZB2_9PEZI|nr:fungal-specific transcription factor domain-containing protein [Colletotrichum navitas]KAK1569629.1 fungal-specific transcription factor domain-containing protein [Colletotrichum navitas]